MIHIFKIHITSTEVVGLYEHRYNKIAGFIRAEFNVSSISFYCF